MKHVIAIIQPQQLPAVKQALHKHEVLNMSCTNILGTVPNQNEHQFFRGVEHEITLFQKVRVELFIDDDILEPAIEAICQGARDTGGSGKIFISDLQDCVTVSSGARGPSEI